MIKPIYLFFTILLLSFCLPSCEKDDESSNQRDLVGSWMLTQNYLDQETDEPFAKATIYIFNPDYSGYFEIVYIDIDKEGTKYNFTWSAENGLLSYSYTLEGVEYSQVATYSIDGDELSLTADFDNSGTIRTYVFRWVK